MGYPVIGNYIFRHLHPEKNHGFDIVLKDGNALALRIGGLIVPLMRGNRLVAEHVTLDNADKADFIRALILMADFQMRPKEMPPLDNLIGLNEDTLRKIGDDTEIYRMINSTDYAR
ncbi:hypothetical protein HYV80_07660 [Candidatus Woesearchaeota archaeon]|nr:hypothetical protein [Candidatus Woesearchaeota archaeon]